MLRFSPMTRILSRRGVGHRQASFKGKRQQRGDIGRVLVGNHIGDRLDKRLEIGIFGHEIGLGIDLDHNTDLLASSTAA